MKEAPELLLKSEIMNQVYIHEKITKISQYD